MHIHISIFTHTGVTQWPLAPQIKYMRLVPDQTMRSNSACHARLSRPPAASFELDLLPITNRHLRAYCKCRSECLKSGAMEIHHEPGPAEDME